MSNSKSKNKRLFSESEKLLRLDMISDDVKDDKEKKKTKALLPPGQKKVRRCYVAKAKEMRVTIGFKFENIWKMVSLGLSSCTVKINYHIYIYIEFCTDISCLKKNKIKLIWRPK